MENFWNWLHQVVVCSETEDWIPGSYSTVFITRVEQFLDLCCVGIDFSKAIKSSADGGVWGSVVNHGGFFKSLLVWQSSKKIYASLDVVYYCVILSQGLLMYFLWSQVTSSWIDEIAIVLLLNIAFSMFSKWKGTPKIHCTWNHCQIYSWELQWKLQTMQTVTLNCFV